MQTEPTRLITAITAVLTSLFGVLAAFGLNLDDGERNAILGVVGPIVVAIIVGGEVVRSKVVSPATAGAAVASAKESHTTSPDMPDINVPGYREAVLNNLVGAPGALPLKWKIPAPQA